MTLLSATCVSPSVGLGVTGSEIFSTSESSLAATSLTRADFTAGLVTKATPVNSAFNTFIVPSGNVS